jgi:hypothetical protein
MSFDAKVLQVMIASPGDVSKERDVATEEINDWNALNSTARNIVLLPVKWETHTTPQYGKHPQRSVNRQILDEADILIGIFGTRIGTPTPDFESGTVEEITRHANARKVVKLYFSEANIPRNLDKEQFAALEKFREECKTKSLYRPFSDLEDFKRKFRRDLALELNDARYGRSEEVQSADNTSLVKIKPILSEKATEILRLAVAGHGDIMFSDQKGPGALSAGGKLVAAYGSSPRTLALIKEGFDQLRRLRFVDLASGFLYKVTASGYEYADNTLDKAPPTPIVFAGPIELSDEAAQLLIAAAADAVGEILETQTFNGYDLLANRQSFVSDSRAETASLWRAALGELEEHGLVGPKHGDVYTVTQKGHDFAKTLDKDPLVDIFN